MHFDDIVFIDALFPFHVLLDKNLRVQSLGRSLKRIYPVDIGNDFFDYFEIERPFNVDGYQKFLNNTGALFLINCTEKEGFQIRGQMFPESNSGRICFLGSPLINKLSDLKENNITFNDFAVHDSITHFLFSMQMHETSLRDAQHIGEKLKEKNERLNKINVALDSFVYKVSHDLKVPAVNLSSMIYMFLDIAPVDDNPMVKEVAQRMSKAVDRLNEIINDFLDLSRLEKVNIVELTQFKPKDIVEDVVETLEIQVREASATLNINLEVDDFVFNKANFKSILQNLISNAVKYRDAEKDCIVDVSMVSEEDYIVLKVQDNGMGMDLDRYGKKLFQMFSRLYQGEEVEGTGVGLYMVKKIIENGGGTISVDSKVGVGTTFTVRLPGQLKIGMGA